MDYDQIIAVCRVARNTRQYHRLATFAQVAISIAPGDFQAWSNLAIAFYALRRYEHAFNAFESAFMACSPKETKLRLRLMCNTSSLLSRICTKDTSADPIRPTNLLTSGWYGQRLSDMETAGQLREFPTYYNRHRGVVDPSASITDCAVVFRTEKERNKDWVEVTTRDGGSRDFPASILQGYPLDQSTGGYVYLKHRIASLGCECYDDGVGPCTHCTQYGFPIPKYHFPKFRVAIPDNVHILGGPFLDVHVSNSLVGPQIRRLLREELVKLGTKRPDSPVPKYHNIIDPNVAAVNGVWVPTEFQVEEEPATCALSSLESAIRRCNAGQSVPPEILNLIQDLSGPRFGKCTIRSRIPDLDPHRYGTLYFAMEQVFNSALPLLANLQLPALLLPGPLQVVVKAQRIVLEDEDLYEGVWHDDGLREHVVAVVLYYYGKSECLEGGNMEFVSKQKMLLGCGDAAEDYYYGMSGVRSAINDLPRCVAAVEEGTMLVFSNYAAVHRVLPMRAKGSSGSRDFIAFFVIDQRRPLLIPDELGPRSERLLRRGEMLSEQLQVRGHFGIDEAEVYSSGNGTCADLAWIGRGGDFPLQSYMISAEDDEDAVLALVSRLNMTPPIIGRGLSFLLSLNVRGAHFNPASSYMLHVLEEEERVFLFVNPRKMYYMSALPEEDMGVCAVQVFESVGQWVEMGFWTHDMPLRDRLAARVGRSGIDEYLRGRPAFFFDFEHPIGRG